MNHKIINFYKFVELSDLKTLGERHKAEAESLGLLGTILLAEEGINVALSGTEKALEAYRQFLNFDERFQDVEFKWSDGKVQPFKGLVVKIKPTIIKFNDNVALSVREIRDGKRISAAELNKIIKEKPEDVVLVDTRNWYETDYGTFEGAKILPIKRFTEFCDVFLREFADQKHKTFVFFCTGGVRCEKVAPWAVKAGFPESYQLEGGILHYFKEFGAEGFQGQCFVFDHRWLVDGNLREADDDSLALRIQPKPLAQVLRASH